jgi:DNA-binding NarL/FixJ family response regulator
LRHLCPETPVCIEAEDADQVLGVMGSGIGLELILLDLSMPGADGFELLSELCSHPSGVPVVVLSANESVETMRKALDCGASGYVPKTTPQSVMLQALKLVLAGGVYVPAALLSSNPDEQISERAVQEATGGARDASGHAAKGPETPSIPISPAEPVPQLPPQLTPRQRQVLLLICQGRSNKMIARDLGLSEFTVKAHVVAILRALDVSNRIEAAAKARDLGFPG